MYAIQRDFDFTLKMKEINREVRKDAAMSGSRDRGRQSLQGSGRRSNVPKSQRTRSLMSYGRPVTLSMSLLTSEEDPQREGKSRRGKLKSNNSTKSTKHQDQALDVEKVTKLNPVGTKLSGRLTLEIDKKLQSVNQSVTEFEKTNKYVKGRAQSAVRRSEHDALVNRREMARRSNLLGMGDTIIPQVVNESVYTAFMDEVEAELNREELQQLRSQKASPTVRIPASASSPTIHSRNRGRAQEESRESISDSDSSSVMKKTMTKFPSEIPSGEQKRMTRPSYMSLDDEFDTFEGESLGPIMPKLSDKAFLTNLKKRGGKVNENIQEIRNQIEAIKQKVEIDKKKADLKSQKLLYDPKRRIAHERLARRSELAVGGTKLTDFIQAHGGTTGSWSIADHDVFLDSFIEYRQNPERLIAACQKKIPEKSVADVMAHIKWYEQYISLTRANQEQLRKWDMKKRQDRQMTYQMASEGQKTKLEDEKRRQEHMKNNREEEKLRSKDLLSQWKMRKLQRSGVLEPKPDSPINFDEFQKEMLDLAEKVQTISNPNTNKKLKPPGKFPALCSKRPVQAIGKPKGTIPQSDSHHEGANRNVTVNLPNLRDNDGLLTGCSANDEGLSLGSREETPNTFESLEVETAYSQGESSTGNVTNNDSRSTKSRLPFPASAASHLTKETMSHKIRAHSQKLKKMELSSQHTKEPGRYEDDQLWTAPSSILSGSRRAVPTWRKM